MANTHVNPQRDIGPLHVLEAGTRTAMRLSDEPLDDWLLATECRERLLELLDECVCEKLVVDVRGLTFLSSSWLELLVSPVREGVDVSICNVSPHLRSILERTRLERLIEIVDSGP